MDLSPGWSVAEPWEHALTSGERQADDQSLPSVYAPNLTYLGRLRQQFQPWARKTAFARIDADGEYLWTNGCEIAADQDSGAIKDRDSIPLASK